MEIPLSLIEDLQNTLPNANEYNGNYICKEFEYNTQNFALYFYKVKEQGDYFWICNPYHVQLVSKDLISKLSFF